MNTKQSPEKIQVLIRKIYDRKNQPGSIKQISLEQALLSGNLQLEAEDRLFLAIKIGRRQRRLEAYVKKIDSSGTWIQFDLKSSQDLQFVDDLIYFEEQARCWRRQMMHNIFESL